MKLSDEMKQNCGYCDNKKYISKVEDLEKEIELMQEFIKNVTLLDFCEYIKKIYKNSVGEPNDLSNT